MTTATAEQNPPRKTAVFQRFRKANKSASEVGVGERDSGVVGLTALAPVDGRSLAVPTLGGPCDCCLFAWLSDMNALPLSLTRFRLFNWAIQDCQGRQP